MACRLARAAVFSSIRRAISACISAKTGTPSTKSMISPISADVVVAVVRSVCSIFSASMVVMRFSPRANWSLGTPFSP